MMICNQTQPYQEEPESISGGEEDAEKNKQTTIISADEWFAGGRRVHFDPNHKKIAPQATSNTIQVFERVEGGDSSQDTENSLWLTLLPSFPDGSYGFAKVERLLSRSSDDNDKKNDLKRLYVEYVGQGDSEKPEEYSYNTMERADLVQAQWAAHGVQRTVVVTMGYSSRVVMELLRRQQEGKLQSNGNKSQMMIEHVLCMNGSLYADGYHNARRLWMAPLWQSRRIGHWSAGLAQRSNLVLDLWLRPYTASSSTIMNWTSANHNNTNNHASPTRRRRRSEELRETEKAIRRHGGTQAFLAQAATVLLGQEHQDWADRWDLSAIFFAHAQEAGITFDLVCSGSSGGRDNVWQQGAQVALVEERLGQYSDSIRTTTLPGAGGHLLTAAQAPALCERIQALCARASSKTTADNDVAFSQTGMLDPPSTMSAEPWVASPRAQYGLASTG